MNTAQYQACLRHVQRLCYMLQLEITWANVVRVLEQSGHPMEPAYFPPTISLARYAAMLVQSYRQQIDGV